MRVIDSLNLHVALEDFEPTDLADFTVKAAAFWHIDLPFEKGLSRDDRIPRTDAGFLHPDNASVLERAGRSGIHS